MVERQLKSGPERIGPFEIERRLGAGGMAEAFEGVRRGPGGFEQRVCVKRVLPAYSTDRDFVKLFEREARVAASLSHRNVTRVVDFGSDGGCHYLALELVEGMDLRRLLRVLPEPRQVPVQLAALLGMEIAEALQHAHTRGGRLGVVVHRDVSPANIMVSLDGDVKLTDFGISKALNESPLTRSEHVRGNVWYMAPEQLEGVTRNDPRSDLFSLGVVLFECLAGQRPYRGATDVAAMMALSEGRRTPIREVAPHLPESMSMIVERLLARRPEDRFQDAGALAEALAPLTSVASARRALGQVVRDLRDREPRRRRRAQVAVDDPRPAPPTAPQSAPEPPSEPVVAGLGPDRGPKPRWRPYAMAPGVWANADRAAELRRRGGGSAPQLAASAASSAPAERSPFSGHTSTAPVLPVARAVWVGALVAAFFVLALLSLACAWLFLF